MRKPGQDGGPSIGEIAIRGPLVMKGYWRGPDATEAVLRDGWLYTGDLWNLDPGGNLFITGRRKDVIVLSNGKNVYPEEIEAHYLQSPFIKEICVLGIEGRPGNPSLRPTAWRDCSQLRRIEGTPGSECQGSHSLRCGKSFLQTGLDQAHRELRNMAGRICPAPPPANLSASKFEKRVQANQRDGGG